ncbi:hypothetical protein RFI_30079, partial [Reticulomyxa filosa]
KKKILIFKNYKISRLFFLKKLCLNLFFMEKIDSFRIVPFRYGSFFCNLLYFVSTDLIQNWSKIFFLCETSHITSSLKKTINSTFEFIYCKCFCLNNLLQCKIPFFNINNMGNRATTQKPRERQTKQTKQRQYLITSTSFQNLKALPTSLSHSQCVLHKYEILICGGYQQRVCYSYHTLKNEYKFICEYPSDVRLYGHCVVKLVDNNKDRNQITLLSFGSSCDGGNKHTLVMKYVSVWSNISKKSNNYNEWIPFTDNHNNPIIIGRNQDNYYGARAVICGSNNHFVFNLNTFQFIKHHTLPNNNYSGYHCFVLRSKNRQQMMKTNKQNCQMLLFCKKTGLSIEYNEDNIFKFHQLPVCDIAPFDCYHMCISMMSSCSLVDIRDFKISPQIFNSRKQMDDISKHFTQSIMPLCCNIE